LFIPQCPDHRQEPHQKGEPIRPLRSIHHLRPHRRIGVNLRRVNAPGRHPNHEYYYDNHVDDGTNDVETCEELGGSHSEDAIKDEERKHEEVYLVSGVSEVWVCDFNGCEDHGGKGVVDGAGAADGADEI